MLVFINDRFVDEKDAKVSVQDRGFRFGDGCFETIAVIKGKPYQWELHLARLIAGLEAINIQAVLTKLKDVSLELLAKNKLQEGFIRISVTRGEGSRGYLPITSHPTIIIETLERQKIPEAVTLCLSSYRKPSVQSLPVQYKLMQGLNSTLARMEAMRADCFEAILLNEKDELCEASSANLFWIKNSEVFTPSLESGCLAGTTRAALMRLSDIKEGRFNLKHLMQADEVFLTNVSWQVMPVIELKGHKTWQVGAVTQKLQSLLQNDIAAYVAMD